MLESGGEAVLVARPGSSLTFGDFQRALGLAELLHSVQELLPPSLLQGLPCAENKGKSLWLFFSVSLVTLFDILALGQKKQWNHAWKAGIKLCS